MLKAFLNIELVRNSSCQVLSHKICTKVYCVQFCSNINYLESFEKKRFPVAWWYNAMGSRAMPLQYCSQKH